MVIENEYAGTVDYHDKFQKLNLSDDFMKRFVYNKSKIEYRCWLWYNKNIIECVYYRECSFGKVGV